MYTKYKRVQCDLDPAIPLLCGSLMQNGGTCTVRPTYQTDDDNGLWACGMHIKQKIAVCECSICLQECLSSKLAITKCKHVFHKKCIHAWLETGNDTCPLCRKVIAQNECPKVPEWSHIYQTMHANLSHDEVEHVMYLNAYFMLTYFPLTHEQYTDGSWLPEELFYI